MLKRLVAIALIAVLAPAAVLAVTSQDLRSWRSAAKSRIQSFWSEQKPEYGFGYAGEMVVGALEEEGAEQFRFEFLRYREYLIKGICDSDCGDMDLYLYDRGDGLVDSDTLPDADPLISLGPGHDGMYTIRATMPGCSVEPCYYAVQVFQRARNDS
jgi:hypothetical protein